MTDIPGPSRRSRRTVPLLAAAGVLAVVALGILLAANQDGPAPVAVASLPPASAGAVSAGYVGSHWRLTAVTDRRGTTLIPESGDAWLELATDGRLLASDAVNTINAHFIATSAGFDVSDAITTLVGYSGDDSVQTAAVTGIGALTLGPPAAPSAPSSVPESPLVHVTVLSADRNYLTVQAAGVRLTFIRTAPATRLNPSPTPLISSAPLRRPRMTRPTGPR